MYAHWLPALLFGNRPVRRTRSGGRRRYRPRLEALESRLTPSAHDTLTTALPLVVDMSQPALLSGVLAGPNQVDLYAVSLHAGDQLTADVTGQVAGTPPGCLRLFDSSGKQLAFAETTRCADSILSYVAPAGGQYYLGVSPRNG